MTDIDISIIIPNYQGKSLLRACLDSISSVDEGIAYELILVDCDSSDGSVEYVEKHHPDVRVFPLDTNYGYGYACNRGAENAAGAYLLFLNNDTVIQPGALAAMIRAADGCGSSLGALGLRLVDGNGEFVHSFGDFPRPLGQFTLWACKAFRGKGYDKLQPRGTTVSGGVAPVDYVTGADLLIPRDAFWMLGGFDEGFFMYFEDAELQYRAAKAGFGRYILDRKGIAHLGGGGVKRSCAARQATYDSLLWYYHLTLPGFFFALYRGMYALFALAQVFNFDYSLHENFDMLRWMIGKSISPVCACEGSRIAAESRSKRNSL